METIEYALGIDSSTQGTTAVLVELESFAVAARAKVRYRDDPRLAGFGRTEAGIMLPPREPGEADQSVGLFLAALDAVLSDLPRELLARVRTMSVSAQQHGQVWLGPGSGAAFKRLGEADAGKPGGPGLAELLAPALASDRAPIWMSSNAAREADRLRDAAGGSELMTALSGSDSPARFSGAVLMHRAMREPEIYAGCSVIHLISSFLSSVLSGRANAPIDWGNGAGTSLMDWSGRSWSDRLIGGASGALPGGASALRARLPGLVHPLTSVGRVARYFSERYGIPPTAAVFAGSGDNPQTKVLSPGDLLSLGTSFVLMAEGSRPHPSANAMYDGLGKPFLFGCRTNGALGWEAVRLSHALAADDFSAADAALAATPPGSVLRVLQREPESFPASPILDIGGRQDFAEDYAGTVDSTLGLVYLGSRRFTVGKTDTAAREPMAITGGAAMSDGVARRVAAIWGRPVSRIDEAGAASGAAVAAAVALMPESGREEFAARAAIVVSGRGKIVEPDRDALAAYHGEDGYLRRLERLMEGVATGTL